MSEGEPDRAEHLPCPHCGYDLYGAIVDPSSKKLRCTECGRSSRIRVVRAKAYEPQLSIGNIWITLALLPAVFGAAAIIAGAYAGPELTLVLRIAAYVLGVGSPIWLFILATFAVRGWKIETGTVGTALTLWFAVCLINGLLILGAMMVARILTL